MINKDKIQNNEFVVIPLKTTLFIEFSEKLDEWVKENPEKAKLPLIDIRTYDKETGPEIMAILAIPDDHTEDLKNNFDETMNKDAEESIDAENNFHHEEEEIQEVEQ